MTRRSEAEVSQVFVGLASALVEGEDVVDLLDVLVDDCARILDVAAAGLLLADGLGVLHVMAASSEESRHLELFQAQRDQGPCRDCHAAGVAVSVPDLREERERWPDFVPAALEAGFVSVHAVPMRLRQRVLGALGLFGSQPGELDADDHALAQAMADVASVALVQSQAVTDQVAIAEQLQSALNSRVVLEQAKGVIAWAGGLEMGEAFAVLRRYARDHNQRLTAVAAEVVARLISPQTILDHARQRESQHQSRGAHPPS